MSPTLRWFWDICTVVGFACIVSTILLALMVMVQPKQGFPKSRRWKWLR